MAAPSRSASRPWGMPGMLCMAKMASQGCRSKRPSSIMRRAPPPPLLRRLEDQRERSVEAAVLGQMPGRRQQHGRMAVMAAGMHDTGMRAGVGEGIGLGDGQRVHVGAQAQAPVAAAAHQPPHNARAAQAAFHLVSPLLQLLRDQGAGAMFLEAKLGVPVDVAAHIDEGCGRAAQSVQKGVHVRHLTGVAGGWSGQCCGSGRSRPHRTARPQPATWAPRPAASAGASCSRTPGSLSMAPIAWCSLCTTSCGVSLRTRKLVQVL